MPSRLASPFDGHRVRITSKRALPEAASALARAFEEKVYSRQTLATPTLLRLRGTMTGTAVSLTAQPYVIPGLPARGLRLSFKGQLQNDADGSESAGWISAPIPRSAIGLLAGSILIIAVFAGLFQVLLLVWLGVMLVPMSVIWAVILRHNQRHALTTSGELVAFLSAVLDGDLAPSSGLAR
jgi:hypothetical protein